MTCAAPFIGRERELFALEQALASQRLVTVTGPGGCGKTRLATEVGERAALSGDSDDRVYVEFASVHKPERVSDAVVRALGVREHGGRGQARALFEALADRSVLLLLDNCEHLSSEVGRLAGELLVHTQGVRLLVTAREPLRVKDELVLPLAPFGLPDAGGDVSTVIRSEAGRFFVDRAVAADAGFALTPATARTVARICVALDGLPLALALAAARVGSMTVEEIADGLSRRGRLTGGRVSGGATPPPLTPGLAGLELSAARAA